MDNGILAYVPGEFIAAAQQGLPSAENAGDLQPEVVIDAGHVGTVRISFRVKRGKSGKHTHSFWAAYRADKVETQAGRTASTSPT